MTCYVASSVGFASCEASFKGWEIGMGRLWRGRERDTESEDARHRRRGKVMDYVQDSDIVARRVSTVLYVKTSHLARFEFQDY